jgi:hypothetical protein
MMALMAVILEIHHPTMKEVRNEAAITLLDDTPFYLKAGR